MSSAFINVAVDRLVNMGEREIDFLLSKNQDKQLTQQQQTVNDPYWTPLEREVLYEKVTNTLEILDGKFKGAQSGKAEKNRAWEEITDIVKEYFFNML